MHKKAKILLVDDDMDFINNIKFNLLPKYEIACASSGKECLQKIKKDKPDIIIMDVMMSTITDGLETAKKIKNDNINKDIPIIMLSSVDEQFDYNKELPPNFFPKDKWLEKPVEINRLIQGIENVLAEKRRKK
jgi:CheY-like chemotaxis protein